MVFPNQLDSSSRRPNGSASMSEDAQNDAWRASRRVRQRRARSRLAVTGEGRFFLLVTLGLGVASVNTGNNLLYLVLGLLLSLVLVSGVLSDIVLLGIRVRRHLPRRAAVGAPCLVEIEIINDKRWLPSFCLTAYDEELEPSGPRNPPRSGAFFLRVDPRGSARATLVRVPSRRGRLRLEAVRITTRYPFGFFEKSRTIRLEDELLVHPALVDVHDLERRLVELTGVERNVALPVTRANRRGDQEIAGLRPHRHGDEARAVHWRRSAALGSLVVREFDRTPQSEIGIALDLGRRAPRISEDIARIERLVSRAASLAVLAHRRGMSVRVLARGAPTVAVAPDGSIEPLLDILALVEPRDADLPSPPRGTRVIEISEASATSRTAA